MTTNKGDGYNFPNFFYSLNSLCLLFFHNFFYTPQVLGTTRYYQRNTLYNHNRCVKSECVRLVNAYFPDNGVETHQQVLTAVVRVFRIIYTVNYDKAEVARYAVLAQ